MSEVLGVTVRELTGNIRQMPGGRGVEGALIVAVEAGGLAAEAGLARNLIVTEVRIGRSERIVISGVDDFRSADRAIEASSASTIALRVVDPTADFRGTFVPVPLD
jgi:S1-C subfamily serine protease